MTALRRVARRCCTIAIACALAACAAGPTVRTDQDPTADFGRYRTWDFYKPIAMEQSGYSSWISERIKEDVRREMESRGYRYSESFPDIHVNFQGVVEDRADVWNVPRSDVQWFYSYRRNAYVAVPIWYDEAQVTRYRQGTLTVDIVDAGRNRMVWTGAAIGRVVNRTPDRKMAELDEAITGIFAQYPYRVDGH